MARGGNKGILLELVMLPWWVSVVVAALVYATLKWIAPALSSGNVILSGLAAGFQHLAGYAALLFLLPAPFSYFRQLRRGRLVDAQQNLDTIRKLSWQQFEALVGEAFRRRGYILVERGGAGPDGGVDLILHKGGQTVLVQCKQWRSQQVGVSVVREQYGILIANKAGQVFIVTSGSFTSEAEAFARGKPMVLVDGTKLLELVRDVQRGAPAPAAIATTESTPPCPRCGSPMEVRIAKQGTRAGQEFWGCSQFPQCRGTRPC